MSEAYAAWAARWRVPLGFVLAAAFVFLSKPAMQMLVAGAVVAFLGLALRAYAAGCLEKSRELTTSGPYRYTRNPLYLGSFFMGIGFSLAAASWVLGAVFVAFFLLVYLPVMSREEAFLSRKFGEAYEDYARSTSLFFPTFIRSPGKTGNTTPTSTFRWERYRRNHEYDAAIGYLCGVVFLVIKMKLR